MTDRFTISAAYENEADARLMSRPLAAMFIKSLKLRGYRTFTAPDPPMSDDGVWDRFADCRVLMRWIPHGAYTELAGKFAVRVDTIATKPMN